MVLIAHLGWSDRAPKFFMVYGGTGVRIFFVISGYLITTLLLKEHVRSSTIDLREFYIRRAYRILPAAGVFLAFAFMVYWREIRYIDMAAALLYVLNFDFGRPWMIGHLWSLSVEEQFYFLWPGALKRFYAHKTLILTGTIAVAPIYQLICYHYKTPAALSTFPAVAGDLAIGSLIAIFGSKIPEISVWLAAAMAVAVVVFPHYAADTPLKTIFEVLILSPLVSVCIAGVLIHVVRRPYGFLNIAPVVWIGRISYSLYLWQQPFFSAKNQAYYKLAFGICLACLSYYLVEQPVLRLRERRSKSTKLLAQAAGSQPERA